MAKQQLTEKQAHVLKFVMHRFETNGGSPTSQDVATWFGISKSTGHSYLQSLERKGYLRRAANGRGYRRPKLP